jgi:hypothetical protein
MEATYSSQTPVDFNGLHGVVTQKTELFTTIVVRTSNLAVTIWLFNF